MDHVSSLPSLMHNVAVEIYYQFKGDKQVSLIDVIIYINKLLFDFLFFYKNWIFDFTNQKTILLLWSKKKIVIIFLHKSLLECWKKCFFILFNGVIDFRVFCFMRKIDNHFFEFRDKYNAINHAFEKRILNIFFPFLHHHIWAQRLASWMLNLFIKPLTK